MNATIAAFGRKDGALTVGGGPVDQHAQRVGSTPLIT